MTLRVADQLERRGQWFDGVPVWAPLSGGGPWRDKQASYREITEDALLKADSDQSQVEAKRIISAPNVRVSAIMLVLREYNESHGLRETKLQAIQESTYPETVVTAPLSLRSRRRACNTTEKSDPTGS